MQPITIVIPTYNRSAALATVLPTYDGHPTVESLVVVDDGSTDGTQTVVEGFASTSSTPVRVVQHRVRRGVQAARMSGAAATRTEWILFGEDDVWLSRDYCQVLYEDALTLHADAIAGRLVTSTGVYQVPPEGEPARSESSTPRLFDVPVFIGRFHLEPREPVGAPYLHAIALIRTSLVKRVGFDPSYGGNAFREEIDFYLGARSRGFSLVFTPRTLCGHLRNSLASTGGHRGTGASYLRAELWGIVNTYRMLRKHKTFLRREHGLLLPPLAHLLLRYCPHRVAYGVKRMLSAQKLYFWHQGS